MGGFACLMSTAATEAFSADAIDAIDVSLFAPGSDLVATAEQLGLGSPEEREFFARFGQERLERLRSHIEASLSSTPRRPVRFVYEMADDFDVVIDSDERAASSTVTFKGPEH